MHCRSLPSKALRIACTLVFAGMLNPFANATPKPLDDAEMSAVRGADGTILAGLQGASSGQNPFASGLALAFSSSTGATLLTPTEFAASLESAGLSLDSMPDYHGEPVAQTIVDAKPVSFTFTLSDVLRTSTGLQFNSGGASFGTFTMTNFDARGTTLWVWQHH
ncbi:MAG: hypothetical protein ABIR54_03390 [Burkholderiaceae bacterium]|jgi:hypothetical protein